MADTNQIAATPVQKVVVVNGNTEVLGMLETVLGRRPLRHGVCRVE